MNCSKSGTDGLGLNLYLCVAIAACSGVLAVILPFIVPFWRANGLTTDDIWLLQGGFAATLAVSQIPTGYLADRLGRKRSIIVGALLTMCGDLLYFSGGSFNAFLAAEVTFGIGIAFVSGADGALLYDTLVARKEVHKFSRLSGLGLGLALLMSAAASVIGGQLSLEYCRYAFIATALFSVFQVAMALRLVEPKLPVEESKLVACSRLREVFSICFTRSAQVRWLIVTWSVLAAASWSAVWFYSPYFTQSGWSQSAQGYIFALYNVVAGVAAVCARMWLREQKHFMPAFATLCVLACAAHLLFGMYVVTFGFLFGLLHQICRGTVEVVFSTELNRHVPSRIRATVLSIRAAVGTAVYAGVVFRLGYFVDRFGPQVVLQGMSVSFALLFLTLWLCRHRNSSDVQT